jgi:hypothetical protein
MNLWGANPIYYSFSCGISVNFRSFISILLTKSKVNHPIQYYFVTQAVVEVKVYWVWCLSTYVAIQPWVGVNFSQWGAYLTVSNIILHPRLWLGWSLFSVGLISLHLILRMVLISIQLILSVVLISLPLLYLVWCSYLSNKYWMWCLSLSI